MRLNAFFSLHKYNGVVIAQFKQQVAVKSKHRDASVAVIKQNANEN